MPYLHNWDCPAVSIQDTVVSCPRYVWECDGLSSPLPGATLQFLVEIRCGNSLPGQWSATMSTYILKVRPWYVRSMVLKETELKNRTFLWCNWNNIYVKKYLFIVNDACSSSNSITISLLVIVLTKPDKNMKYSLHQYFVNLGYDMLMYTSISFTHCLLLTQSCPHLLRNK